MSGGELTVILAAIVLATAVLPPAAAWSLNQWRVARAAENAGTIAAFLRMQKPDAVTTVVCGAGRLPRAAPSGDAWLRSIASVQDAFGPSQPRDPWGRCYAANLGGSPAGQPVLVLSAGPNGLIETPLGASAPHGDDVGTRLQ